MKKLNPILRSTLVLTVIAIVCGAALGLSNRFLKVEKPDTGGIDDKIKSVAKELTGSDNIAVLFYDKTGDTFTVNGGEATITKTDRDKEKTDAAYFIKGAGSDYFMFLCRGAGRNGWVSVLTAFELGADASSDKMKGMRPYDKEKTEEYTQPYNDKFYGSFSDKAASKTFSISDTDGYSGATATAKGLIEAVNNASAFLAKHRGELMGQGKDPFIDAAEKAYPGALKVEKTTYAMPDGMTLYSADGVPLVEVAGGGFKVLVSFAGKGGLIRGIAVYGASVSGALSEAAEKIIGNANIEDSASALYADISGGAGDEAVRDLAECAFDAYDFFINDQGIFAATAVYDAAVRNAVNKIADKAKGTAGVDYAADAGIILAADNGESYINTVKYNNAFYYSAYKLVNGDYVIMTLAAGYNGAEVLGMTYINGADDTMEEFMLFKRTGEEGYYHYLDDDTSFIKGIYRGMLGTITAGNYKSRDDAKNGRPVAEDPDPDIGTVTQSYNAIADCLIKAANVYRAIAGIV